MKALISGASRGIGKAIAEELAGKGYDLILISRGLSEMKNFAQELIQNHPKIKVEFFSADLANEAERTIIDREINMDEAIDILVNNLGVYATNSPSQTDYQDLTKMLKTNLFSAINLTQTLLPVLKLSKQATIINIGSVMSHEAIKYASDYSISKHALKAWNDALREELRTQHIKVSSIYPGAVNTSSWDDYEADRKAMIQPKDVAKLVSSILEMGDSALVEEIRLSPMYFDLK